MPRDQPVNFQLPGRCGSLMPDNSQAIEAWERTLDLIELDLQEASSLATDPMAESPESWEPPTDLPPMPLEVVDRARQLLKQQSELLNQLESTRRKVRRHLQYLDANAAKGMGSGPRFIDAQS
jgi:hypothetical protein